MRKTRQVSDILEGVDLVGFGKAKHGEGSKTAPAAKPTRVSTAKFGKLEEPEPEAGPEGA